LDTHSALSTGGTATRDSGASRYRHSNAGQGLAVPVLRLILTDAFSMTEIERVDLGVFTWWMTLHRRREKADDRSVATERCRLRGLGTGTFADVRSVREILRWFQARELRGLGATPVAVILRGVVDEAQDVVHRGR
jgi:hypothetical protein